MNRLVYHQKAQTVALNDWFLLSTCYWRLMNLEQMDDCVTEMLRCQHQPWIRSLLFSDSRDENQGSYLSRWSAVDFASLQPRSETFCLRWNNLGVAESFNCAFMKSTQPACYTDADLYPLSADRSLIPSGCRRTVSQKLLWYSYISEHELYIYMLNKYYKHRTWATITMKIFWYTSVTRVL